jgi:hypothetical protein
VIGDCFVLDGQAHGTVLLRTDGTVRRAFDLSVMLGTQANPLAVETVRISADPGQIARAEVTAPTSTPNGRVQCSILSVVDQTTGQPPIAGEPLPPPPDTHPMPAQPGAGAPSGPSVPATAPPPVVPGRSPS